MFLICDLVDSILILLYEMVISLEGLVCAIQNLIIKAISYRGYQRYVYRQCLSSLSVSYDFATVCYLQFSTFSNTEYLQIYDARILQKAA